MKEAPKHFLIVDDDPLNNFLSIRALKKALGEIKINDFVIPEEGLSFIQSQFSEIPSHEKVMVLLDINMPTMTGWEFLDNFSRFSDSLKNQFSIYILSSSIDPSDINRAKDNPFVVGFIEKPLYKANLLEMFQD